MKRDDSERPSLSALLKDRSGEHPHMNLAPIHALFGDEAVPDIDESQAGRIRLHQALANKFGPSYKSHAQVRAALDHYNRESEFLTTYKKLLKGGGRKVNDYANG